MGGWGRPAWWPPKYQLGRAGIIAKGLARTRRGARGGRALLPYYARALKRRAKRRRDRRLLSGIQTRGRVPGPRAQGAVGAAPRAGARRVPRRAGSGERRGCLFNRRAQWGPRPLCRRPLRRWRTAEGEEGAGGGGRWQSVPGLCRRWQDGGRLIAVNRSTHAQGECAVERARFHRAASRRVSRLPEDAPAARRRPVGGREAV
jgi:hypothetical protein